MEEVGDKWGIVFLPTIMVASQRLHQCRSDTAAFTHRHWHHTKQFAESKVTLIGNPEKIN